jgi:predicted RNase H-like HicB family nuclease
MLLMVWYLSFTATRLDRLHHRVETTWANLDAALQQRAGIALEIARSGVIDPASSVILSTAAHSALVALPETRSDAEEDLSEIITSMVNIEVLGSELRLKAVELTENLNEVRDRVKIAISFHVEAVNSTKLQRSRGLIKIFRLAGRAPDPVRFPFEEIAV